jgi:transposase
VAERLAILEYARTHGAQTASLRFGLCEKTLRRWRKRWRAEGVRGLIPRYPARRRRRISPQVVGLVTHAREQLNFGSTRTRLWLLRAHQIRLSQTSIQRIVRELALPSLWRPARKRQPRQLRLFERERPGDCVQVDVKFVRVAGQRRFQYTAIDDCTRYRVLRLYRTLNQWSSLAFFD